jgi:hypothetical protein
VKYVLCVYISTLRSVCAVPSVAVFCGACCGAFPVCCSGIVCVDIIIIIIIIIIIVVYITLLLFSLATCLFCSVLLLLNQRRSPPLRHHVSAGSASRTICDVPSVAVCSLLY